MHVRPGQRQSSTVDWIIYIITFPSRVINNGLGVLWSFISSFLGFDANRAIRQRSDGREDVRQFIQEYEQRYGAEHPPFNTAGYYQVLEEAKRDLRFLLVYLHSDQHQDSDQFARNVLANQDLIQRISDHNIIFWACSVSKAEGHRVSQALRESTYPFLAMIVLRQHRLYTLYCLF